MNEVIKGDCLKILPQFNGAIDLIFADPPYNIGFKYDLYDDKLKYEDYSKWTRQWIKLCGDALRPNGSAFFMIGDEFAAETRLAIREAGLHVQNWIVWTYTFGQHRHEKYGRSHVHIFFAVKDPKNYTFNDIMVRVPSQRGLVYNDKRADPRGRLPQDTWDCYPRMCGTFKARQDWHGCQLPEDLLARVILGSSNKGDVVLDPFAGSGTTLLVAKRHGRRFLGIELSPEYVEQTNLRLKQMDKEPELDSAGWPMNHRRELIRLYRETKFPLDAFETRPAAKSHFTTIFNARIEGRYTWGHLNKKLLQIKSEGALPVTPMAEA